MEILGFYTLFAIATSLTALYELVLPVFRTQEKVEHPYLLVIVFFLIFVLAAPLVFLSCIVPSMGVRFRIALQEGVFPKEEKSYT